MRCFTLPEETPPGLDSPVTAKAIKYLSRIQVKVFTLTNGRIGSTWRIGAGFRKPVPTIIHLRGRPNVPVLARVASKEERAALWPRLVDLYADFAKYQAWTQREIPVIVLTPPR